MRVGFIGLGSQGAPMAQRIIDAGFSVVLWARRQETLKPFLITSAAAADSPFSLGSSSDLVCICVVSDADVTEVVTSVLPGLAAGSVIAVHSTVHPSTCRDLAAVTAERGVQLIDAPVSGGAPAAAAGRLLLMAGGDAAVVESCRPVFATFADPVVRLGPLGSGQVAKLLNNLLFTANLGTAASTLALARSLDVDPAALASVIGHGSGSSFALDRIAAAGGTLDRIAAHAGELLRKDVKLAATLSSAEGADGTGEAVLAAADGALTLMHTPR
jgi:3-hydroxyisobutyrate dehydrogenase